jgi:hypothetical protein
MPRETDTAVYIDGQDADDQRDREALHRAGAEGEQRDAARMAGEVGVGDGARPRARSLP